MTTIYIWNELLHWPPPSRLKRVIHGWKWFVKTLNTDIKRLVGFFFTALNLFGSLSKQSMFFGHLAIDNYDLFFDKKTTGGLNCYISHLFITMKNYYYFLNLFSLKAYLNVHHSQFILCHWKNSITTLTNVFISIRKRKVSSNILRFDWKDTSLSLDVLWQFLVIFLPSS